MPSRLREPNFLIKRAPLRGASRITRQVLPVQTNLRSGASVAVLLGLAACSSSPKPHIDPILAVKDRCLTGYDAAEWSQITEPPEAAQVRTESESAFAEPMKSSVEFWFSSGDNLLYCRAESWCIAETWLYFLEPNGAVKQLDRSSWICVTGA